MNSILLISSPGAGKGVISKYLNEKYNYFHISMGNLLRDKAKENVDISELLKQGKFVDNNIVYDIFEKQIKNSNKKIFAFDGFPRNMSQVQKFEEILKKYDIIVDKVIYVDIKKEIAEKRISGRLMCLKCNNIYNKYFDNIKDNICKSCGEKLQKRNDDKISTYEKRYDDFVKNTIPLIDYYKKKGILYTINNNDSISNAYNQIDKLMVN